MTRILLNLSKGPGFVPIDGTCSIHGDRDGLRTLTRQFANVAALEAALDDAGVAQYAHRFALQAIHSSMPTFIELSELEARKLGVLAN
jgi:hypothetical protein